MRPLHILAILSTVIITAGIASYFFKSAKPALTQQQMIIGTYIDQAAYYGATQIAETIGLPGYAPDTKYNVFNFAFYTENSPADASDLWINPIEHLDVETCPWGKTNADIQKAWLNLYHQHGKKVILSAFGATVFPTSLGLDATITCTRVAQVALTNNFDGVDIDWEDNEAMEKGTGEQWLIDCTKAIRQVLPVGQYILSHAPQAPYFIGKRHYLNGGYVTVNNAVGNLIDYYNVQFYDQGDTQYVSYQTLFNHSEGSKFNNTAVGDLIATGVPMNKIIIGKPATTSDASNTGYVEPNTLGQYMKQAGVDQIWQSGVFTWQYSHDRDGNTFLNPVLNNYLGPHHHHHRHHHDTTTFLGNESE